MRTLLLALLLLHLGAAETRDELALNALAALQAARGPGPTASAADVLGGWLRGDTPLAATTWEAVQKGLPAALPRLDPSSRHRLVQTVVYWAPETLQADAQRWNGEALDAVLAAAEAGLNQRTQDILQQAGQGLPSLGNMPPWRHRLPAAGEQWRTAWAEGYRALYTPRAKRIEALANAWDPARTPGLGSSLAAFTRRHPDSQALVRILLRRAAACPGAEQPLRCGLGLLSMCLEPYEEGPALVAAAAAWFGQDLEVHGDALRLWRGEPRLGSALSALLLDPAGGTFARRERVRAGDDGRSCWTIALPPPEARAGVITRLLDGLETGLAQQDETALLTFQLAFHVLAFPDGYGGLGTPETERRCLALLAGTDDLVRLLAFHLLGHLAGPARIDAAYATALPQLKELLLPTDPSRPAVRGPAAKPMPEGMGQLLVASRLRLSLCRVPLAAEDRQRALAWVRWRSDFELPVAAWLVRSAEPGENPLAGRRDSLAADYWPRLVPPQARTPRPPADWRANLASGRSHLIDVPAWAEGPAVVDAHLADPKQFPALLHMLTYARRTQPQLAAALHGHQPFREAVLAAVREPPREGQPGLDRYNLAVVLGDILLEPRLAAEAMAALPDRSRQISFATMYIARWAPDHPSLDALSASWDDDTSCRLANPFRRWFLAVLRGRDPGTFPRTAWICHLQQNIGDRIREIVEAEPQRFAPHRDVLRTPCAPRFENYLDLAMIEARLTP